ncbi:MAG: hypothetical protein RL885_01140 [Planctomycetota bacterium]
MSVLGKVFVVVNLILAMLFVGWAATMLGKADQWKQDYQTLQEESTAQIDERDKRIQEITAERNEHDRVASETQARNRELTIQNEDLKQRTTQLESDKGRLEASVEDINVKLGQFRDNNQQAQARITQLEDENDQMQQTSNEARDAEANARQNAARLQEELNTANETIGGLNSQLTSLQEEKERLDNVIAAVNAVNPNLIASLGPAAPKIDGKVTGVRDEFGFVQLSVGSDDGVQPGFTFEIFRGRTYLAQVMVRDVQPDTAWAKITLKADGESVRVGDDATTQL